MSLGRLICARLLRWFQSIMAVFQRALCFMRKRDNIGELPFVVRVDPRPDAPSPTTSTGWEDQRWDEQARVESKIEEFRRKQLEKASPPPDAAEPDFFSDMQPESTKQKKAILKPRRDAGAGRRNLFVMDDSAAPPVGPELGELDEADSPTWEDDLGGLLESHRAQVREERLAEHARRNEMKRATFKGS